MKDKFLVEVNDQFIRPDIKGFEFIDTDYNPKALATKIGRIHSLSISVGQEFHYDLPLKERDVVVFNHIVCQNANKFSETLFFADYFNIFGVIQEGELVPLEEVIFCEKIVEPDYEVGGLQVKGKVSDKCATVVSVSKVAAKEGIQAGDIIFFTKNADYPIVIAGKEFYKMHIRNVIGIERNGELKTFKNKLLVKDVTELGRIGDLEKIYANTSLRTGVVKKSGNTGIEEGTVLTYFNGVASSVNWKGEDYAFLSEDNIKFLY